MRSRTLWGVATILAASSMLVLAGCGGGAAAPTAAPAKPAATAAPAAPTTAAAPAPTTAAAAAPSAAAKPAASVPDDEKPLAQPYKITIGAANNLFGTALEVGLEKGIWLKHGIQAQIKMFSTGQEISKALTAGDVQLGSSAMNNFQSELVSGVKHTGIVTEMGNAASLINDAPLAITARADSGIRAGHPEDLKGKTVGLSLGGTAELYLRAVLKKANIDPSTVKMVNVPPANSLTVLQNKNVDAVSSWEPYQSVIMAQLPGAIMVQQAGGYFGYLIFCLVEPKLITDNPDLVLRMVAGYSEASMYTRQHPDEAGVVSSHWIQGLDPKIATAGLKNVVFDPRITTISQQAWDLSNQLLLQDQRIKQDQLPKMEGNFNTTFLAKVMQDHPDYFKDLPAATPLNLK